MLTSNKWNLTTVRLYRILLRQCRSIPSYQTYNKSNKPSSSDPNNAISTTTTTSSSSAPLFLQRPLNPHDWGVASLFHTVPLSNNNDDDDDVKEKGMDRIITLLNESIQKNHTQDNQKTSSPSNTTNNNNNTTKENDSFFVTGHQLEQTIRREFRRSPNNNNNDNINDDDESMSSEKEWNKSLIMQHHKRAIDAIRILEHQISLWETTSVNVDEERGLRVVATSSCIGKVATSASSLSNKYRFAYRIRVENINPPHTPNEEDDDTNGVAAAAEGEGISVQLLGRTWVIEDGDATESVNQPTGGAVGKYPVISPGEVFEYMSGCDIHNLTGNMSGLFHMAIVPAEEGQRNEAGYLPTPDFDNDENKFDLKVNPFRLVATTK